MADRIRPKAAALCKAQSGLVYNLKPRGHFRVLLTHKAFKETTDIAKNQILQQSSTAMLAKANASKQNVLSLLQG